MRSALRLASGPVADGRGGIADAGVVLNVGVEQRDRLTTAQGDDPQFRQQTGVVVVIPDTVLITLVAGVPGAHQPDEAEPCDSCRVQGIDLDRTLNPDHRLGGVVEVARRHQGAEVRPAATARWCFELGALRGEQAQSDERLTLAIEVRLALGVEEANGQVVAIAEVAITDEGRIDTTIRQVLKVLLLHQPTPLLRAAAIAAQR